MQKISILGLLIALSSLAMAEDTVLVPLDNGQYKRVPISEIMPEANQLKIKEIKEAEQQKIEEERLNEKVYVSENVVEIKNPSVLEDLLKVSVSYENKKFDKKSIEDNKNPLQNKVAADFIKNSKIRSKVTEDLYLFNIDLFGSNSKFEVANDEKLKNNGFIASVQYGVNNNINIKFNAGYSKSKFLDEKVDNTYLSLDYNYFQYNSDYEWEIGTILGYLNGESSLYRVEDQFIGMIYSNIAFPLTETIQLDGSYETTILSNKLGLGITKNIYYFDNFDIQLGLSSDYTFGYDDKEKKIYTHLDEDKPSININIGISIEQSKMNMYYDFQYESAGLKLEYKF